MIRLKYKILKTFKDIHTGEIYETNTIADFTKTRADEILKKGKFIEEVKDVKKRKTSESSRKNKTKS